MKTMRKLLRFNHIFSLVFTAGAVLLIAYFNFFLIRYFFDGEFNQNIASIEISYIQMAKFWVEGRGLWQPLWYLGYPWHVFYTPLLPALEVLTHNLLDFSFAHAYRVITAAGYVLTPVCLYFFVWQISKSKLGALISALFYTFVPSVIGLLFTDVRQDTISGIAEPRRYTILVRWGEGPHILALVFLPLFGVFLSRFLNKNKFWDLLISAIFLGLIALTNAIALWAAVLLIIAFFLAGIGRKSTEITSFIKQFLKLAVLTYGLTAFWYNLPFIKTFFAEGGGAFSNWAALFPWSMIPLALVNFGIVFLIRKLTDSFEGIAFSLIWFLMLFSLVFAYYASGEERIEYVPQALRLNTEVDLALSILVGAIVSNIYLFSLKIKGIYKIPALLGALIIFLAILLALFFKGRELIQVLPEYTKPLSASKVGSIENTAEYRVS